MYKLVAILILLGVFLYPTKVYAYVINCSGGGTLTIDGLSDNDPEDAVVIKKIQGSPICTQNKDPFVCRYESPNDTNKDGSDCRQEQGVTICREGPGDLCQWSRLKMQERVINAVQSITPTLTPTPTVVASQIKVYKTPTPTIASTPTPTIAIKPSVQKPQVKIEKANFFQSVVNFISNLFRKYRN